MLDSGTTLTRLHGSLAYPILDDLGAITDSAGYYLASCSLRASNKATINFGFSNGAAVSVPLSDFILDLVADTRGQWCYVGLAITSDQQVLGDSFLRAGYFVFDWDNQAIHIAQAASCGSEMVVVGSGPGAVPSGIVGNCAAAAASPTLVPMPSASAVSLSLFCCICTRVGSWVLIPGRPLSALRSRIAH